MTDAIKLPPLPEGSDFVGFEHDPAAPETQLIKMKPTRAHTWFTASQMQAYATAAVLAHVEAQQAEIGRLREQITGLQWTIKDALESVESGMLADAESTLRDATKETP